ncbi:bacillithiol system redox-active protein YtxJ [Persicobacter psychrovividus]|uniref:Thioredoxin family protein n=1 Tax=Persicobacter psychrovividus TaxID=387638 RepID=A0ABN6L4Y4_9BACT|nr:thioredoxin family protein [Persicobacter psychrovividus]
MNWNTLDSVDQLDQIAQESFEQPVVLFKHSTRCPTSAMSLRFFENGFKEEAGIKPYFLDLIVHRDVSNEIAVKFGVLHQSPQVILLKDGKAVFDASHHEINFAHLPKALQA